jgi:Phytanoyl-CoA dioxygenase (PhyH)
MHEGSALRKTLEMRQMIERIPDIVDMEYWRRLNPAAAITAEPIGSAGKAGPEYCEIDRHIDQLREEGYFQTPPLLSAAEIAEMRVCIETVRAAGLPVMLALVYDVFYHAFRRFDPVLGRVLGPDYQIVPNFWVYYIEASDKGKGFEPHRDAEYNGTIGPDGVPTVLTVWVPITDAIPLNSCMYVVPASRDPQYARSLHDLQTGGTQFALEDIRAIPAEAGTLNCWDQYIFHWGSRSSRRADEPRISYALYCQRGDMPPVDGAVIDLRRGIDFQTRLGLICRGMYRYSYLRFDDTTGLEPLLAFLSEHMAVLESPA